MAIAPLQLPQYAPVPQVDWSPLSKLGDIIAEKQRVAGIKDAAAANGGNLSLTDLGKHMLMQGDTEGAMRAAQLASAQTMQQATIQNMQANQGFQGRQVSLAEKQAQEKPQVLHTKDPAGNDVMVEWKPDGTPPKVIRPAGMETEGTNPFASGKQTESQSKDSLYASRMFQSEKTLRDVEKVGSDWQQRALSKIPVVGNFAVSQDYQKFDQAQRDFINAVLRRESGAAIHQSEFDNANKQYFPQPGDSADTLKQKRANRAEAIKGVAGGGGPQYRPPNTIGPNGEMVENPAKPKAAAPVAAPTAAPGAAPVVVPGAASAGPAKVSSPQEYASLPSGATYMAPDGSLRTKR